MVLERGAFIVFEGCDRCGKTTQSKKIFEFLKTIGMKSKHMAFPDRNTAIGSIINSYLSNNLEVSDESIHLLFAANRWEMNKEMKKLLHSATNLIVDRYSYSGVAFSTGKGLDYEWCKGPEVGLIKPDLVIYMKMETSALANRGNFGDERYEKVELQNKVRSVYDKMLKGNGDNWIEMNADDTIDNIFKHLSEKVLAVIEDVKYKPLQLLW